MATRTQEHLVGGHGAAQSKDRVAECPAGWSTSGQQAVQQHPAKGPLPTEGGTGKGGEALSAAVDMESSSWPATHRSGAPSRVRRSQELLTHLSHHLTSLSPWHH